MNKETLRMQMLAGIITESQYKAKLTANSKMLNEMVHPLVGGTLVSHQEAQDKIKEFAEGLKSHLEKNGYAVTDNAGTGKERNIVFSYDPGLTGPSGKLLMVYYDKNNEEAISTIVNYLDYFNKSKFSLGSKAGAYTTAMQKGYLSWHLNVGKNEKGNVIVGYLVNFKGK